MVLYAYRAIRLFGREGQIKPDDIDHFLARLLTFSVLAMFSVAIWKNTPMRVFTLLGAYLCVLEWRELKAGVWDKPTLFRRHQRYILASYFYVLTVVSIVHLKDELPTNLRWLWPAAVGVFSVWMLGGNRLSIMHKAPLRRISQGAISRWVVWGIASMSLLFGAYVVYDLIYGPAIQGQT